MPRGRGRAVSVTCQCIFFVEWEIHVQVTPLNRPLPPGEGWGEGLPATSDSPISSHPLSRGSGRRVRGWRLDLGATSLPAEVRLEECVVSAEIPTQDQQVRMLDQQVLNPVQHALCTTIREVAATDSESMRLAPPRSKGLLDTDHGDWFFTDAVSMTNAAVAPTGPVSVTSTVAQRVGSVIGTSRYSVSAVTPVPTLRPGSASRSSIVRRTSVTSLTRRRPWSVPLMTGISP